MKQIDYKKLAKTLETIKTNKELVKQAKKHGLKLADFEMDKKDVETKTISDPSIKDHKPSDKKDLSNFTKAFTKALEKINAKTTKTEDIEDPGIYM